MSTYTPDAWIVVKCSFPEETNEEDQEVYKILAGWYGGFARGDSWKLNSGITKIVEEEKHYIVSGYSGSIYICNKGVETTTGLTQSMLLSFQSQLEGHGTMEKVNMIDILSKFK